MALPLKSGADLYTQELLRARLHNYDGDLSEYGVGSIYYNTTSGLNTSDRIRYRGRNAWHSVANLEDITRLEGLIADLGDVSGGNITDLLNRIKDAEGDIEAVEGRVKTIEDDYLTDDDKKELSALITALQGYFSNGVANDAAKLGGQLPSYYAQSSVLGQLRTEFDALYKTLNDDTEGVINTWQEVVDFVNEYSGSEDLSTILAGMNTQIADRYTKGEVDTKLSAYRLLTNGTFDVLVNAKNGIETDEITIGGIKLSVVDGQLQIDGDAFATGQLASGGIGEAGSGSGASGIVILEDWSKYDDSVAQVVGAVLGKDLHDRLGVAESTLESLVGKATNVSVVQTLTSGKEIGAITIDGVATKLYAPATYAWSEITSKPTTAAGYGITNVVLKQDYINLNDLATQHAQVMGYGNPDGGWRIYSSGILSKVHDSGFALQGLTNALFFRGISGSVWEDNWHEVLHTGNYASVLGTVYAPYNAAGYLPLSGGTLANGHWGGLLTLKTTSTTGQVLTFENANGILGHIGVSGSAYPFFADANNAIYNLIHNGNFNSYAPTLTGVGASGRWGIGLAAETLSDLNDARHGYLFTMTDNYGSTTGNKPHGSHVSGLTWAVANNSNYRSQLASATDSGSLFYRHMSNSTWEDWKTLAFTDSDITGNAAGLKHSNGAIGAILNSSGNVTIGASDLAGTTWRLFVDKSAMFQAYNDAMPTLGSPAENMVHIGQEKFGMQLYATYGGNGVIQSGRIDGTATAYNLNLQPLGGDVVLGSANSVTSVNGNLSVTKSVTFKDNVFFSSSEGIYLNASGINWSRQFSIVSNLIGFTSNKITLHQTTSVSSRLLVGGATDNTLYALNVNGRMLINNTISSRGTYGGAVFYSGIRDNESLSIECTDASGAWTSYGITLLKDGNVGIGTITPQEKLHVVGNLYVTGNIIADGQVSSGGVAEEGTGGAVGGSGLERVVFTIPANTTTFDCVHNLGTREISVAIYEEGNDYQQILTDVYLDSTNIARVVFGSATDVAHKVVIIG